MFKHSLNKEYENTTNSYTLGLKEVHLKTNEIFKFYWPFRRNTNDEITDKNNKKIT